jgi:hypothetical protein
MYFADSNYHSYPSLALCKAEGLDAYIPDIQFRKRHQRFAEQDRFKDGIHPRQRQTSKTRKFTAADFTFDESKQTYLCPQGKELTCSAHNQRNRYRLYDIYHARQVDCARCPLKSPCLSKPDTPFRYLSVRVDIQRPNLIDEMKTKIDTPEGKQIYARRLAIVEPVFANIRVQKRLDRFTVHTKAKVDVQWRLFALVHNVGKIHNYGLVH